MFSGLVSTTGTISEKRVDRETMRLVIRPHDPHFLNGAQVGDSVGVDGTCLTVENINDYQFTVTLMP